MKNVLIFSALIVLFSVGCRENSATSTDPTEILNKYFEYRNAHDIDKTLSLFSDSAVFVMDANNKQAGKANIRKLENWNAAIYGQLSIPRMRIKGDTVHMSRITEVNQWYLAIGIDSVVYNEGTYAIVKNGLITEFCPATLERNSGIESTTKLRQFMTWATENRKTDVDNLMPNRQFDFKTENAFRWIELMREWRVETGN